MEAIIPLCKAVHSCVSAIRNHAKNSKMYLEDVQQTIDLFHAAVEPHIRIHQQAHGTQKKLTEPLGRISGELEDLLVEVLAYAERKAKKYTVDVSNSNLTAFAKIRAKASSTASALSNELGPLRKRSLKLYQERLRNIQIQIQAFMQTMVSKSLFDLSLCVTKLEGKLLGCNEILSAEVNEISTCIQQSFCATECGRQESLTVLERKMEGLLSTASDNNALILQAKVTEEFDRLHKFQQELRDHVMALQLQQEEDNKLQAKPSAESAEHKLAREKVAAVLESSLWKNIHGRIQPGTYVDVPDELLCPVLHRPMYDAVTVICEGGSCSTVLSEEALRQWVLKEKRATDINNNLIDAVAVDTNTRCRVEFFECLEQPCSESAPVVSGDALDELQAWLLRTRQEHLTSEMQDADRNADNFVSWEEWKSYVGKHCPAQYRKLESTETLSKLFGRSSDDAGLLAHEFEIAILKLDVHNSELAALSDELLMFWLPSEVMVPEDMVDKLMAGMVGCTAWTFDRLTKLVDLLCRLGMQIISKHHISFLSNVFGISSIEGLPDELADSLLTFVELVRLYVGEDTFSRAMCIKGFLVQLWQLIHFAPLSQSSAPGGSGHRPRYRPRYTRSVLRKWLSPSLESIQSQTQCQLLRCLHALRLGTSLEDVNVFELMAEIVKDGDDETKRVFGAYAGQTLLLKALLHTALSTEDCARCLRILSAMSDHGIYSVLKGWRRSAADVSMLYSHPEPVPQEYVVLMTRDVCDSLENAFEALLPVLLGPNASHRERASQSLLSASKECKTTDSVKKLASITAQQSKQIIEVLGGVDVQARICMANGLAASNVARNDEIHQALEMMLCSDNFSEVSAAASWLIPHYNWFTASQHASREQAANSLRSNVTGIRGAMIKRVLPKLITILSEPASPRRAEFCRMLRMFALAREAAQPFFQSATTQEVLVNFFLSGSASDEEQTAVMDAICCTYLPGTTRLNRFVESVVLNFLRTGSDHQRSLAVYALGNLEDRNWGSLQWYQKWNRQDYESIAAVAVRCGTESWKSWPFCSETASSNGVKILIRYMRGRHEISYCCNAGVNSDLGKFGQRFLQREILEHQRRVNEEQAALMKRHWVPQRRSFWPH